MLDESLQVFVFRCVLWYFRKQLLERAIHLGVSRDLREQRALSGEQHRLGDDIDDLPGERLKRLCLTPAWEQARQAIRHFHSQHEIVQWVAGAGEVGKSQ